MPSKPNTRCIVCGDEYYISPSRVKRVKISTCSYKCRSKIRSGSGNPRWNGGILQHSRGYLYKSSKKHPNSTQLGYVMEHRLVIEKKLGRYLRDDEIVHHKNGIKNDNRIENLELTKKDKHMRDYHQDVIKKMTRANIKGKYKKCEFCGNEFWAIPSRDRRNGNKFCSNKCRYKSTIGNGNPNSNYRRGLL